MRADELAASGADARLARAAAVILQRAVIARPDLDRLPNCGLIVHAGRGAGGLDLERCRDLGILVASVPDAATPELAALAEAEVNRLIASGGIEKPGAAVRPWRIGLIGFGKAGRAIAALARAQGWEVWAVDPFINPEHFRQFHVRPSPLAELMGVCDVVVMAASPSRRADPLVGAAEIALMRRGAAFICVGAPALVDLPLLARARAEGRLAAAIVIGEAASEAAGLPTGIEFIAANFGVSSEILGRAIGTALEYAIAFLGGVVPTHLLIDPPLPRAVGLTGPA